MRITRNIINISALLFISVIAFFLMTSYLKRGLGSGLRESNDTIDDAVIDKDSQLANNYPSELTVTRLGEDTRRYIYFGLRRAMQEASYEYKRTDKNLDELMQQAWEKMRRKYNLTRDELNQIYREGLVKTGIWFQLNKKDCITQPDSKGNPGWVCDGNT